MPSVAVQTGQDKRQYVFVVKPDKTVEARWVTEDRIVGSETVIKQGLKPGEQVVTDGHDDRGNFDVWLYLPNADANTM